MTDNIQTPAEGILMNHSYGASKMYTVACECSNPDCSHTVWVEADDYTVTVTSHTIQHADYWTETVKSRYDINNWLLQRFDWFWKGWVNTFVTRLRLSRDIWFRGVVKYEASLIMTEQTAINYAHTLLSAINDVKTFRDTRNNKKTVN